jgi:hypothetical protein
MCIQLRRSWRRQLFGIAALQSPLAVTVGYTSPRFTCVVGTPAAREVESERYKRNLPRASGHNRYQQQRNQKLRGRRR